MSILTIDSCVKCSSSEALWAVSNFITINSTGSYRRSRVVNVLSIGFAVEELARNDELTSCNGDFRVTKIGAIE